MVVFSEAYTSGCKIDGALRADHLVTRGAWSSVDEVLYRPTGNSWQYRYGCAADRYGATSVGIGVEPDPAEMTARYGADTPVRGWHKRLVCSRCGGREGGSIRAGLGTGAPPFGPLQIFTDQAFQPAALKSGRIAITSSY
jgi:hypothetical protein